jgi:ATP-dependent Clp protease adaptor protein ClpS
MEFVIMVLQEIFRKPPEEATRIMLNVHKNGIGLAGVYVRAVAEAKVAQVHALAEDHGYPLKCSMEPE